MQLRRLFLTADRRPALVWRIFGYAVLFGGCLSLRGLFTSAAEPALKRTVHPLLVFPLLNLFVVCLVTSLVVGVTYVFRRFVDRRPWEGMAMPSPWRRRGDLVRGFALGAAMILVVFGIEYVMGWIRTTGIKEGFGWAAIVAVLAGRFIYLIGTATCEEIGYRSYLLQNVGERFPVWIAVLTTGAVFGASHYASFGFTWGFVVSAVVASFLLAVMRFLTRAIWLGVGWHLGWDSLEDGLGLIPGYSPLQTERTGPPFWAGKGVAIEGGLLIILVLALALAGLLAWSRYVGRPIDWSARLTVEGDIDSGAR